METVLQIAKVAGGSFAAALVIMLQLRKWWKAKVAPILAQIAADSKGANEAVNNVTPGTPPLSQRFAHLEKRMDGLDRSSAEKSETLNEHGQMLRDHGVMLNQIYDALTKPQRS